MSAKCNGYNRHRWEDTFVCKRCGKRRNPAAGLKMFRPVKRKEDRFNHPAVCPPLDEASLIEIAKYKDARQ